VAPDYPGFGQSGMPSHKDFAYTFENLTNVVEQLVDKLGLSSYSLYVMDYGAPVGYRLALRHPDRVQALIVQNGNAYDEGLLEFWDPSWVGSTWECRDSARPVPQLWDERSALSRVPCLLQVVSTAASDRLG